MRLKNNNVTQAAKLLGINRNTLSKKLKGLDHNGTGREGAVRSAGAITPPCGRRSQTGRKTGLRRLHFSSFGNDEGS